jgi:membrane protein implicated in regulation of membrane protease activity
MEIFTQPALIWFFIGLGLILFELAVPGFVLIFFGVGAWCTALLTYLTGMGLIWQIAFFVAASVITLVLLRKYLKKKFFSEEKGSPSTLEDEFIGKTAVAETDIVPDVGGKVSFKGTIWTAKSDTKIIAGSTVVITGKESITLFIKPFNN